MEKEAFYYSQFKSNNEFLYNVMKKSTITKKNTIDTLKKITTKKYGIYIYLYFGMKNSL